MPNWLISSAYLELSLGNFEQALRELDRALDLASEHNWWNDQSYCLCLKGLVYLRMKSINMAQETAGRLMQFVKQNEISDTSYLDFLLGSIELERGNYSQAISIFEKALSNNEYNILYSYAAAQAYYGERSLEKAQKECEKILSYIYSGYRIGYPGYSDLYSKLYYVQGLIFEQKGWKDKAIENYEKFLDLWKDADPGIVEVEDARDRLAGLK
jgi:tetratricopeptide (TPR) repeat protein